MQKYIGVKIILAEPMDQHSFLQQVKNEDIPEGQENREGYKVVYPSPPGELNHISWSPKEVFEGAYRLISRPEFKLINQGTGLDTTAPHGTPDVPEKDETKQPVSGSLAGNVPENEEGGSVNSSDQEAPADHTEPKKEE